MKIAAIITEYNPFHNGHAYQIAQLREKYDVSHVVCIMSSSFMQRGEPAIFDKMERAAFALRSGANAVFELPYVYSGQTAEIFAKGSVGLAIKIKADILSFGCENTDMSCFDKIVRLLNYENKIFQTLIKRYLSQGHSYAVSRVAALEEITGEDLQFLSKPNNILALEYLRQIENLKSNISVIPILRKNTGYHSTEIIKNFASASLIRKKIKSDAYEEIFSCLPQESYDSIDSLRSFKIHDIDRYKFIIKAFLTLRPPEELSNICDMEEGLENRLINHAHLLNQGIEQFLDAVSTKRYAKSRIRRILFNILFHYTADDMQFYKTYIPDYIRILGVDDKGREVIKHIKNKTEIQVITNLSKDFHTLSPQDKKIIELENRVYELYHLFDQSYQEDAKLKPSIFE